MRKPEENQGEGIARFSPAWDLRPMKESAESWIQEGRALNALQPCASSLEQTWRWRAAWEPLPACPVKLTFHSALEDPG